MCIKAVSQSGLWRWFDAVFGGSWRSWSAGLESCVGGPKTRRAEARRGRPCGSC